MCWGAMFLGPSNSHWLKHTNTERGNSTLGLKDVIWSVLVLVSLIVFQVLETMNSYK